MVVKVRQIEDAESVYFTEIHFSELDCLIEFIKQSGGIRANSDLQPFHSYQLEIYRGEAFAEIIVGEDE